MKYAEIFEIKLALDKLGKERLPIAFEVAKNLRIAKKILDETQEIAKELHAKFADKDEKGEIKTYKNEEGGQEVSKITDADKLKEYQTELKKLDAEEHEVVFVKITKSQLAGEKLPAEILVSLIDTIITD
ncbi:MAG: hypothetical protein WC666_04235 [Candidatus Paceibacterota bacterium]|jgi:hypothetical protein